VPWGMAAAAAGLASGAGLLRHRDGLRELSDVRAVPRRRRGPSTSRGRPGGARPLSQPDFALKRDRQGRSNEAIGLKVRPTTARPSADENRARPGRNCSPASSSRRRGNADRPAAALTLTPFTALHGPPAGPRSGQRRPRPGSAGGFGRRAVPRPRAAAAAAGRSPVASGDPGAWEPTRSSTCDAKPHGRVSARASEARPPKPVVGRVACRAGIDLVTAVLGVLKAGAAFLPARSPRWPGRPGLADMAGRFRRRRFVVTASRRPRAPWPQGTALVALDRDRAP